MKKLFINLERCFGCKRCELACIIEHSEEKNYAYYLLNQKEPKTRIFVENYLNRPIPLVCHHCKDALCISACISGCMQKDEKTDIVRNDNSEQKCVGCWMCILNCPFNVIDREMKNDELQAIKCDFCANREIPACVEACPNEVISVIDINE
ncbi:MAG TPA: 4Fe-4S dicluster domain-containing protein [bacterium]|nr:4Fe-4S dicluster domain-containing protein [bacterium]HOL47106.1 4Fe-4S dicluster domain-containing protein [bacterium]HPQ18860.1 4Fe-4S dicluster domain-containing protein [bacterium]